MTLNVVLALRELIQVARLDGRVGFIDTTRLRLEIDLVEKAMRLNK